MRRMSSQRWDGQMHGVEGKCRGVATGVANLGQCCHWE